MLHDAITHNGGSTGDDPRSTPLPQTAAGQKKIETPGRSKVGFTSPKLHQNSPLRAQTSKNFLRRHNTLPGGEWDTPSSHPPPSAPGSRACGARLDGAYSASDPGASPATPSASALKNACFGYGWLADYGLHVLSTHLVTINIFVRFIQ